MPRILIVPGSYKTTMSSLDATKVLLEVLEAALPNCVVDTRVMTDGGEGTIDAFAYNFDGVVKAYNVMGPLGETVQAKVCWLDTQSVVVESAQVVGYSLVPPSRRDPWQVPSSGVGQLVRRLVADGATKFIVTMGDSAIMDMGIGMLDALGVEFYAGSDKIAHPRLRDLGDVTHFDSAALERLSGISIMALVDTKDYLCGDHGQASTYGLQKGIRASEVGAVERALRHFSTIIARQLEVDVSRLPMATGSGGLAAAFHAFLAAPLMHTPEYFSERIGLEDAIRSADYVITGEGRLDDQTRWGKVPHFVASRCSSTCLAIVGSYTNEGHSDLVEAVGGDIELFTLNPEQSFHQPLRALADIGATLATFLTSTRV